MAAEDKDLNRDPISDEPGSHPVGTGVGATAGAVAGAAAGTIGGPVGMAVGGVIGAVVGGLAGKAAAEAMDPTAEEAHWRENYEREPYYEQGRTFDDYSPAYRQGYTARTQYDDWDSAAPNLQSEWESARGGSSLSWDEARPASRAAWDRVDMNLRGDGDRTSGMPGMDGTRDSHIGAEMGGSGMGRMQSQSQSQSSGWTGDTGTGGAAAAVGAAQSAGDNSGDTSDVIDVLQDLAECSKDGEYGFRECAEQAKRSDLKSLFLQRADDCRGAVQELNEQIRMLGGNVTDHGSAAGAMHRGWVSIKSTLTTYDDKAVLEECERGEDNAKARYAKALKKPLPAGVKLIVERQMQGVQRNHDQIKMMRDQLRQQS
jgi:uncharacterized protein (TIGR02284 family)